MIKPAGYQPQKQPLTVKIAVWSARHAWPVAGLWFLMAFGLFGLGLLAGTNTNDITRNSAPPRLEAARANQVFEAGGGAAGSDTLVVVVSHPALKLGDPAFREAVTKIAGDLRSLTYHEGAPPRPVPVFSQVTDFYSTPLAFALASPDATSARLIGAVQGETELRKQKLAPARSLLNSLKGQFPDFQIYGYNGTLLNEEFNRTLREELDGTLKITLPLTFLILLAAFGAVAAAVVPIVLALTALLAAFGILAFYSHLVSPVDSSASQVIILIGLAVGIDYSLFMITRYRTERRRGRPEPDAIRVASSTAGRAVFFSGLTVIISLAGLYLVGDAVFGSIATGTIGVVLVAVIGSLTFLPATLAILGNGINWGRVPYFGREREEGQGFWAGLVGAVMRRPLIFALLVTGLLLALAAPVLHIRLGSNGLDGLPDSLDGVKALRLMNQKWPQGTTLRMQVIVTGADRPETRAAIERFKEAALQTGGLSGPVETTLSRDGTAASLSFFMAGSRNSPANQALVARTRQELIPAHLNLSGVQAYVTGQAAYTYDLVKYYVEAMPLVIGFVLGLSFLLLLIAFRSLIIPLKAIILNLFSTGAAYGVMVLVFQDGWFSQQIGFQPTGVIENFAPLFMFTILFGLSMDYHLFILTRIKEARDRGAGSHEAVAKGISITSGTITSAAAIMVVVFAVFVTLQIMVVRQLGLGLAVAVFVDATIIRSVLLPATMKLLGDWNWWLPGFLQWLPHVTIEGESADEPELSIPRPEAKSLSQ